MSDPSGVLILRRIGYETIHQGAQHHELADGKSGNGNNRGGAGVR